VRFSKQRPKHLEDLHILFDKTHGSGATASCPDDISSFESNDEDVVEVKKSPHNDDVKLAALKKAKPERKNARTTLLQLLKRKMRRVHSFECTRTHI
jgi:hypothetical protein